MRREEVAMMVELAVGAIEEVISVRSLSGAMRESGAAGGREDAEADGNRNWSVSEPTLH